MEEMGKEQPKATDRLSEIRARWERATPGPWGTSAEHGYWQIGPDAGGGWAKPTVEIDARCNTNAPADARAIASAPSDIAWLLGEVERIAAERDEAVTWRNGELGRIAERMEALRAALVEACDEIERMGDPAATPITSEATITRLRAVAEGKL